MQQKAKNTTTVDYTEQQNKARKPILQLVPNLESGYVFNNHLMS